MYLIGRIDVSESNNITKTRVAVVDEAEGTVIPMPLYALSEQGYKIVQTITGRNNNTYLILERVN